MPYSNYPEQAGTITAPQPTPELQVLIEKITLCNQNSRSAIYEIEEKLHSVLNTRQPTQNEQKETEKNMPSDFTQAMHEQINYYLNLNERLQKIVEHLKRIVG